MITKRPVLFDLAALKKFPIFLVQLLIGAGLQSVCCVPLITRARVLGTLNVGSTRVDAFASTDLDATAARTRGRYSKIGPLFRAEVFAANEPAHRDHSERSHGRSGSLFMAWKHS